MSDLYYFYNYIDDKGNHEIHTSSCSYLPASENRTLIGYASNCKAAIEQAKLAHPYKSFDGCYHCSYPCHKG